MTENSQQMDRTENERSLEKALKHGIIECQEFWENEWVKQYEGDKVFWKKEIISLNLKIGRLTEENATLRMKYETTLSKKEALNIKYTTREAEIAEVLRKHLGQIETLSNLYAIETKTFEEFRKNTVNKEEHISALENQIKQYQQKILDKTQQFESASTQMKAEIVEAEKNLKKQIVINKTYLKSEKTQAQAAKLEKMKYEQVIQKLETEVCKFKEKQEEMKRKVVGLEEKLEVQKKKTLEKNFHHSRDNENLKTIVEKQKCHIVEMRKNEAAKNKVINKLKLKISELEGIIKGLNQESLSYKLERNKILNDLSKKRIKTSTLKVSLLERIEINKNLEAQLEKERQKQKELTKTMKSLTLEKKLFKEKYDFLEAKYKNGKPEMDKCKLKIKQMERKIISMQCDIQNCVDVFECPRRFLQYFIQLKMKHLDNTKMTEVDSQFELFHRYIKRLKNSFDKTITHQSREKDKIKNMLSKETDILYLNSAKAYEALQKCKILEEEKQALDKKLRMTEQELQILKNPAKSKVQCWLAKFSKSKNKVHPI
ncbi:cilia- and flagella-associated protein 58-like [Girardinichthys multiradiatus]|uniref:cilia- and flagella-associated protein 58-like n=1 Tax=Girardinichthys multiradiatus TaxID=208333 RepID=UPI001FAD657C|nr:cilia- and flagella-associated protein 58-like [Girardinichthys multiradiatus]XP_047208965.1 cilia- and flagella-associated protein 58-like [Girardinichthys multiradiatus]XP_047208966.1 cilia- and flagella-associated protein 58-like [Girardinichthys multiradiatus]